MQYIYAVDGMCWLFIAIWSLHGNFMDFFFWKNNFPMAMKGSWLYSIILVMKSLWSRHELAVGWLWRYENPMKWWTFLWIVHGYFIDNPVSSVWYLAGLHAVINSPIIIQFIFKFVVSHSSSASRFVKSYLSISSCSWILAIQSPPCTTLHNWLYEMKFSHITVNQRNLTPNPKQQYVYLLYTHRSPLTDQWANQLILWRGSNYICNIPLKTVFPNIYYN